MINKINSNDFISKLRNLNVCEADIKDLLTYRYKIDYNQVLLGRLYMLDKQKAEDDINLIGNDYPISYLIGFVDFFGLRINVDSRVLIPRPETEQLMEIIYKNHAKSLINNGLDLCTGSGCIALSLKKMFPHATIYGSDISYPCLQVSQQNADINKLEIYLAYSNYFEYFINKNMTFDIIVSNPPYIKKSEILDRSLAYEPQIALYSGMDGLTAFYNIFLHLNEVLNPHGVAYFEMEASNSKDTILLAREILKSYKIEVIKDMNNKDRFLKIYRGI